MGNMGEVLQIALPNQSWILTDGSVQGAHHHSEITEHPIRI